MGKPRVREWGNVMVTNKLKLLSHDYVMRERGEVGGGTHCHWFACSPRQMTFFFSFFFFLTGAGFMFWLRQGAIFTVRRRSQSDVMVIYCHVIFFLPTLVVILMHGQISAASWTTVVFPSSYTNSSTLLLLLRVIHAPNYDSTFVFINNCIKPLFYLLKCFKLKYSLSPSLYL